MSDRGKLLAALGAVAVVALLVLALLGRGETSEPESGSGSVESEPSARTPAQTEAPARVPPTPAQAPPGAGEPRGAGGQVSSAAEPRDATGELLSAGPAEQKQLPERPEGALDHVPTEAEAQAVLAEVLDRLDAEIAAAEAAGDTAEAQRLAVRRSRIERKLAQDSLIDPEEP